MVEVRGWLKGVAGRWLPGLQPAHVHFAGGQLLLVAATFVFNLVAARLLGPADMGLWQTANLIATYGVLGTLGVMNGMAREIPYHLGRRNMTEVRLVVATSLWVLVGGSAVLWVAAAIMSRVEADWTSALWLGLALLAARILNGGSTLLLRSFQDFVRLGAQQAGTALLLVLSLAWLWKNPDPPSLLICFSVALVAVCVLSLPHLSYRPVSRQAYLRLVRIGTPIMLAGVVFSLLVTVDRFLILTFLDTSHLGLYTPAISAFGALLILPGLVSNVMYPRLAVRYGETGSVAALVPGVWRMLKLNIAVTWPVAATLAAVFYFFVIPFFLPAYLPGRLAAVVVLLSAVFLPVGQSFGDLFNVIGWQRWYLRNMTAGFFVNAAAGYLLVGPAELGLVGVAWGTVAGIAVYALLQILTFRRALEGEH